MREIFVHRVMGRIHRGRAFWSKVPTSALFTVLGACFFTMASLVFTADMASLGARPAWAVLLSAGLAGATATAWVLAIGRSWHFLLLALALQVIVPLWRFGPAPAPRPDVLDRAGMAALQARMKFDMAAVQTSVVGGYTLFFVFIGVQGRRYLRDRTEIELARVIHGQLVQPIDRRIGGYEFHGHSLPSGEVGGDLVDVLEVNGSWMAYLADVSGHGVAAGALMGMFKSAVHSRVTSDGSLDAVLDSVHRVLVGLRKPGMFVTTAFVAPADGDRVAFALAGHPPILHYRAATRSVERLSLPQMPLAMLDEQSFTSTTACVAPGDVLALVSDGLMEVFDKADREFGLTGLEALLLAHGEGPLAGLSQHVFEAVHRHGIQLDDQSLLLARRVS